MTKICSKCGEPKEARGFLWHEKYCKGNLPVVKERFPKQKAILSPEAYTKFVRKAEGI